MLGCGDTTDNRVPSGTGSALQQSTEVYEVYEGIRKSTSGPATITLAQFERLREGMTYEQAVATIGAEADVITDDSVGPAGAFRRVARWINGDGTYATVTFLNVRLNSKEQQGLQ